jgi:hypothetical protein
LIETANDPSTGVRLHVDEREDETWLVLEGEYTFQVGAQTFCAHAGPTEAVLLSPLFDLDRATPALSRQGICSYSPALVAKVSTTAMFCSNSGGNPCRSCKYAELL